MHVISAIIALLGGLALAIGAAIWFAPSDNVDAAALAKIPAMIAFAVGVVLLLVALIARIV